MSDELLRKERKEDMRASILHRLELLDQDKSCEDLERMGTQNTGRLHAWGDW